MKVLVTGSEGSLMQTVIPKLQAKGYDVTGIDNCFRYGRVPINPDYDFIQADLTDYNAFVPKLDGKQFNVIIQAAARIYGVGGFNKYPADILGEDITLHNNILCYAKNQQYVKPKMVYISSSMVYETVENSIELPLKEEYADHCITPKTDYGLSKFVGERLTKAFHQQYGIEYTIFRPFNIITPHEEADKNEQGRSHVFADFIQKIAIEKSDILPLIGNGKQIRCFTWIDDVASGIADNINHPAAKNDIFNLGNNEPYTMMELAIEIAEQAIQLGIRDHLFRTVTEIKKFQDDVMVRIPDISKALKILNWKPTVNTSESIRRCLQKLKLSPSP